MRNISSGSWHSAANIIRDIKMLILAKEPMMSAAEWNDAMVSFEKLDNVARHVFAEWDIALAAEYVAGETERKACAAYIGGSN